MQCVVQYLGKKKDGDGSGNGRFDWTSLMGKDKRKLLDSLPDQLNGVLYPKTESTVIQLWKVRIPEIERERDSVKNL